MIALNTQPTEKRAEREDGALDIVDLWLTIQGEGPFTGTPAIFVRLAGCTLRCELCDTDYTTGRQVLRVSELMEQVRALGPATKPHYRGLGLVVITGGEPFRQNCGPFVRALMMEGYRVQFETNGTMFDESMEAYWSAVTVVCSPKSASINPKLAEKVYAYKYVIRDGEVDPNDGLPTSSLLQGVRPYRAGPNITGKFRPVKTYIQPCDEGDPERNKLNTEAAVRSCMEYGYVLQLQIHKIVGLP